ncbi:MAG: ribonuclease P protein component [Acidimicrobiales bacterium]
MTRHSSFAALRRDGQRVRSGPVSVVFAAVEPHPALAFAIGKKFGTAVERNRARRRLRSAFHDVAKARVLPPGAYQISCSRAVLTSDYTMLATSLDRCLDRLSVRGT